MTLLIYEHLNGRDQFLHKHTFVIWVDFIDYLAKVLFLTSISINLEDWNWYILVVGMSKGRDI